MEQYNNAVQIVRQIISSSLLLTDDVVDATVGNGHDTLFLAEMTEGTVYGFDIQAGAVEATRALLAEKGVDPGRVRLFLKDHADIEDYVPPGLGLVLFNLGYLPGGDKSLTTREISTLAAVRNSLKLIKPLGKVLIVVYSGHAEGMSEKLELLSMLKDLDQGEFNVVYHTFPNQRGNPPELICIEKREKSR